MPRTHLANIGLVILAGGTSRRFQGRQKMLVDLGGRTIGSLLFGDLAPAFSRTYLSVRDKEQARILRNEGFQAQEKVIIVEDLIQFPGGSRKDAAIFGLYSALLAVQDPFVIVVSGDMPFVSVDVASVLVTHKLGDPDAVIPRWKNGYLEPTMAIYKTNAATARIKEMLVNKQYQLVELARGLAKVVYVPIEDFKQYDPELTCFVNMNTESDLERARQVFKARMEKN